MGRSGDHCPGGDTARPRAGSDVAEAEAAIERLAITPADEGLVMRDIWSLRLRALLAHARGDDVGYTRFRDHHHEMAKTLGYEGISRGQRRCHDDDQTGAGCASRAQWTATDLESLPHRVQYPALAFALSAVREHEPCQARRTAR